MIGEQNVALELALDEIYQSVSGTIKNRTNLCAVEKCNTFFSAIQEATKQTLDNYRERPSVEDHMKIAQALYDAGHGITEETLKPSTTVNHVKIDAPYSFHAFQTEYARYALSAQSGTVKILPYLLAAFYLNCNCDSGTPADISAVFSRDSYYGTDVNNRTRAFKKFTKRFSLKETLKKPRDVVIEELGKPCRRKNGRNNMSCKLVKWHYESIFRAIVYSLCVLACMHDEKITNNVDYRLSYELFDAHTAAFHSLYLIAVEDDSDQKDVELINPGTILDMLKNKLVYRDVWKLFTSKNDEDKEIVSSVARCGITASVLKKWSNYGEPDWYLNMAATTVVNFHPANFWFWERIANLD